MEKQKYRLAESFPAVRQLLQLPAGDLLRALTKIDRLDIFVQSLPPDDFFLLIKRIGAEDALPVLQQASNDQWQYLLDLEIWTKDLPDAKKTLAWLDLLRRADQARFAEWVFQKQAALVSLLLLRQTEIIFKEQEDAWDIPPGYFTLDGSFYIKVRDENSAQIIENLLRALAGADYPAYCGLLQHLLAIVPAETEEELYRLRSVRLAELGFAPFEEALEIYAPLDADALQTEAKPLLPGALIVAEEKHLVPASSLSGIENFPLLQAALQLISDPHQADRVRLEFAALCNKLIAADGFAAIEDYESILNVARQAAGYLHLAVETLCAGNPQETAKLLADHSLQTIFRVGFGLARKLQWRAKRWLAQSWFRQWKKWPDFWGPPWQEALEGLLFSRPLYFDQSGQKYRNFESAEDLRKTQELLEQLEALDSMLARLTPVEEHAEAIACEKFYPLLFNRWARHLLGLEPSFARLSGLEAAQFFRILRAGETSPPYTIARYREVFLQEFLAGAAGYEEAKVSSLRGALEEIWQAFCREYENVRPANLDTRWSPYLLLAADSRA